ncbi:SDR family oxidoreductase [Actinoallomurus iriomotensis]|uniref:FAD dependent oxidoreductase n=1 Tax=Actinoallomurus iriomotensis TaxID=478107 RepID=A0A9W6S6Q5_9ACTN|nr:SDR family oxidoreductase [Actinoallomurus iriomotensis]GLY88138.1 hypothetical protein Airi02_060670 [Actinoallomurus iriomotensis]
MDGHTAVLGLDVGGTRIKWVRWSPLSGVLDQGWQETPRQAAPAVVSAVAGLIGHRPVHGACAEAIRASGGSVHGVDVDTTDITLPGGAESAVRDAHAALGGLDGVVHAVGMSGRRLGDGRITERTGEAWAEVHRVNHESVFRLLRATIPEIAPGGSIVIVGSALATSLDRDFRTVAYAGAKGALIPLVRSAAYDAAPAGVRGEPGRRRAGGHPDGPAGARLPRDRGADGGTDAARRHGLLTRGGGRRRPVAPLRRRPANDRRGHPRRRRVAPAMNRPETLTTDHVASTPLLWSGDVVVVGGGSAGCAAAVAAARAGARTLLVEAAGFLGGAGAAVLDTFYGFYAPGRADRVVGGIGWEVCRRLLSWDQAFERPNTYGAGTGVTYEPEALKLREYTRFLRSRVPGYADARLISVATHIGVRESRRLVGRYVLTREDVLSARRFADEIAQCGAPIEDHAGGSSTIWQYVGGDGDPTGMTYGVPYRCLLPREVSGLLVAGRCLSVTHDAHASIRSMGAVHGHGPDGRNGGGDGGLGAPATGGRRRARAPHGPAGGRRDPVSPTECSMIQ